MSGQRWCLYTRPSRCAGVSDRAGALRVLATRGTSDADGYFTTGRRLQAPVNLILIKHIAVIGVRPGEYERRNPEKGRANTEAIYRMASNGEIDPYVCRSVPLEQAMDAMRLLENRDVVGKTVVTMNGYSMQA